MKDDFKWTRKLRLTEFDVKDWDQGLEVYLEEKKASK